MTALYSKYRPQTLAEVVGQDAPVRALSRALTSNRLHHAYILDGPRGCGKTSTARILAMGMNCVTGPTPSPCGTCESCVSIRARTSMDVVEIDAASKGGVDDARELREKAQTRPASSRFRIYIIDEAHMLSTAAWNAMLKLFEEPPAQTRFILATTEPEKVLTTITSRSFTYHFQLVGAGVMLEHLRSVVEAEGASVEDGVLPMVVRAGGGSVRDALSVLDQLLSGVGGAALSASEAASLLGLTDEALLSSAVDAALSRDAGALFGVVESVATAGLDPRRFCQDLLARVRDVLVLKTVPGALARGLVGPFSEDESANAARQAHGSSVATLTRTSSVIAEALDQMRSAANPRLVLELAVAKVVAGEDERLARVEQLLGELLSRPAPASAPIAATAGGGQGPSVWRAVLDEVAPSAPTTATTPVSAVEAPVSTTDEDAGAPVSAPAAAPQLAPPPSNPESWGKVVEAASSRRKAAGAILRQQATVVKLEEGACVLTFPSDGILRTFESWRAITLEALAEALGGSWSLTTSVV